ncbi:MAG: hypothetical protein ACREEM_25165 [Blastocatellia bacterium]
MPRLSTRASQVLLFILISACFAFAQSPQLHCRIHQISTQDRSLRVECRLAGPPAGKVSLRIKDQFADMERLSERVHGLKISGADGGAVLPELRGDGLFAFAFAGAATIRYEMRLARAYTAGQHALVSSLGREAAVLMTADLLPHVCTGDSKCDGFLRLQIAPPAGWKIATTEKLRGEEFEVVDPSRAVFFLGDLREHEMRVGGMNFRTAIAGAWNLSDDEVFKLAEAIAREQAAMIGSRESGDFLITLAPYPQPMTGLRSSAVAVGRSVVLMLNESGDAPRTLAHYRKHLAHEMFHFYLPNAFRIRENFDWFWEGVTRYAALVTLARLRFITQREYLDAIGEEYESYASNPLRAQVSLIAASPEKFSGAAQSDLVYRKGMLVAALYDWELRWQSRGKLALADVMRAIYRDHGRREVGNREALDALRRPGGLARQIRDDIESVREIEIEKRIEPYGLTIERSAATKWKARLIPAAKPSDRQRDFIARLTNGG